MGQPDTAFVGIDVSKAALDACLLGPDGRVREAAFANDAVGPGDQGGVPGGVVGEGRRSGLAAGQQQAGVQGGLGDVDPDGGGGSRLAHGVLPSGSWMRGGGGLPPPG